MKYLLEFLYLVLMKQKQKLHQSSVKGELSLKRPKYLKGKFILFLISIGIINFSAFSNSILK